MQQVDRLLANQKKVSETHGIERAIRGQIAELVARYNNPESVTEDAAVGAALTGRPAFWRRTRYHNAVVGQVCVTVNLTGDLMGAVAASATKDPGKRPLDILAELIPLNITAVIALDDARARLVWAEAETRNVERVA